MMTHQQIEKWLISMKIAHCTIRKNGVVDVAGDVYLRNFEGTSLPIQFGTVAGRFNYFNSYITSFEGTPQYVGGEFNCFNSKIPSFHNIHKQISHIGGGFYCTGSETHLLGLLMIDGITNFDIDNNGPIDKIFNKYIGTGDILSAQDELIDAGFIEQARL